MRLIIFIALTLVACKKETVDTKDAAPKRGTPEGCEALFDSAHQALMKTLPSARPCQTAVDCEVVDTGGCIGTCGTYAVPHAAASAMAAKQREIGDTTCKKWMDDDCIRITPKPMASCATPTAACRSGSCELVHFGDKP